MQRIINDVFDFANLAHDACADLLARYNLHLTVAEAVKIQTELLHRPPTYTECMLWSIQASEHCSYKSSRKYLRELITTGSQVILGPAEDAGIVTIGQDEQDRRYGVVVSHESHNHPSQIVPYEGAATGIGGNVRDVCCMGAEVIAVGSSLRFGSISSAHTHWLHDGVVSGIGGYGNPLGIPHLAGDLYYNPCYQNNCLVTAVTLGVVREDHIIHSFAPQDATDYVFILVGKPTDNSGFGGAAFASAKLKPEDSERNKGAVQEPNAFLQRHLLMANYALFKQLQAEKLIDRVGFKDLGAGGIACASVELVAQAGYGAEIDLELVPTSMPNLAPEVILCAETQERFMWVVPADLAPLILEHYNQVYALPDIAQNAQASVIGRVTADGMYRVNYHSQQLVDASARAITSGILYERPYILPPPHQPTAEDITLPADHELAAIWLRVLAHENIASRAPVFETYDKQVQGRTIIEDGRADAGVVTPFNDDSYPPSLHKIGLALTLDQNPRYCQIDSYWGAVNAVVEAARNIIALGAEPLAISDCLCFGNPENPVVMGELVVAIYGIRDACCAIKLEINQHEALPVIAGNVSLYNETDQVAIPPSPMIACIGKIANVAHLIGADFKSIGSKIAMVGARNDECGGSVLYEVLGHLGTNVPRPDLATVAAELTAVHAALSQGLVVAAHDISDGGLAVAVAEMSFANQMGINLQLSGELPLAKLLFSESGGFVFEVEPDKLLSLQTLFGHYKVPVYVIGETIAAPQLKVNHVVELALSDAHAAFITGLRMKLL